MKTILSIRDGLTQIENVICENGIWVAVIQKERFPFCKWLIENTNANQDLAAAMVFVLGVPNLKLNWKVSTIKTEDRLGGIKVESIFTNSKRTIKGIEIFQTAQKIVKSI